MPWWTEIEPTSQRLHSCVIKLGSNIPASSASRRGRNSIFRFRYARSTFVKAVFFFRENSERRDNVGAGNKSASLENVLLVLRWALVLVSPSRPCRPFYYIVTTTSFASTASFLRDLSWVDWRVGKTGMWYVAAFNRCAVVERLRSTRWRLVAWTASLWPASESGTATTQRTMSEPYLERGCACRRSKTISLYMRLHKYRAIVMSDRGGWGGLRLSSVDAMLMFVWWSRTYVSTALLPGSATTRYASDCQDVDHPSSMLNQCFSGPAKLMLGSGLTRI